MGRSANWQVGMESLWLSVGLVGDSWSVPVIGCILTALIGAVIPGDGGTRAVMPAAPPMVLKPSEFRRSNAAIWDDVVFTSEEESEEDSPEPRFPTLPELKACRGPVPRLDAVIVHDDSEFIGWNCCCCSLPIREKELRMIWDGRSYHTDCFVSYVIGEDVVPVALEELYDFHDTALPEIAPLIEKVVVTIMDSDTDHDQA